MLEVVVVCVGVTVGLVLTSLLCTKWLRKFLGFKSMDDNADLESGEVEAPVLKRQENAQNDASSVVGISFEPLPDVVGRVRATTIPQPIMRPRIIKVNRTNESDRIIGSVVEFPRDKLFYISELGTAWFGTVLQGEATNLMSPGDAPKVVVRVMKDEASPDEVRLFLEEVAPYRELEQNNVLRLLGQCSDRMPFLTLMEYSPLGNLKTYLQGHHSELQADPTKLLTLVNGMAAGLSCLHRNDFIHRDFAARSCQVSNDLCVKVGDYGFSEHIYKDDYYDTGSDLIPLRWMAPETLSKDKDNIQVKPVTKPANVWSFGVALWEVVHGAGQPYEHLSNQEVLDKVVFNRSVQLDCLGPTTDLKQHLYEVMCYCWLDQRPNIDAIYHAVSHLQDSLIEEQSPDSTSNFDQKWEQLVPRPSLLIQTSSRSAVSDMNDMLAKSGLPTQASYQEYVSTQSNGDSKKRSSSLKSNHEDILLPMEALGVSINAEVHSDNHKAQAPVKISVPSAASENIAITDKKANTVSSLSSSLSTSIIPRVDKITEHKVSPDSNALAITPQDSTGLSMSHYKTPAYMMTSTPMGKVDSSSNYVTARSELETPSSTQTFLSLAEAESNPTSIHDLSGITGLADVSAAEPESQGTLTGVNILPGSVETGIIPLQNNSTSDSETHAKGPEIVHDPVTQEKLTVDSGEIVTEEFPNIVAEDDNNNSSSSGASSELTDTSIKHTLPVTSSDTPFESTSGNTGSVSTSDPMAKTDTSLSDIKSLSSDDRQSLSDEGAHGMSSDDKADADVVDQSPSNEAVPEVKSIIPSFEENSAVKSSIDANASPVYDPSSSEEHPASSSDPASVDMLAPDQLKPTSAAAVHGGPSPAHDSAAAASTCPPKVSPTDSDSSELLPPSLMPPIEYQLDSFNKNYSHFIHVNMRQSVLRDAIVLPTIPEDKAVSEHGSESGSGLESFDEQLMFPETYEWDDFGNQLVGQVKELDNTGQQRIDDFRVTDWTLDAVDSTYGRTVQKDTDSMLSMLGSIPASVPASWQSNIFRMSISNSIGSETDSDRDEVKLRTSSAQHLPDVVPRSLESGSEGVLTGSGTNRLVWLTDSQLCAASCSSAGYGSAGSTAQRFTRTNNMVSDLADSNEGGGAEDLVSGDVATPDKEELAADSQET